MEQFRHFNRFCGIVFLAILFSGFQVGGLHLGGDTATTSGTDYSDIIWYHNCDALTTATKSGGSSTVNFDAGILLNTTDEVIGTGCFDQNNDGFDDFDFAISGNVDFASGRIGFYLNPQEGASGKILSTIGGDFFINYFQGSGSGDLDFTIDMGPAQNCNTNMSTGTWYFLEFEFNSTTVDVYMDGSSVCSLTGGTEPNDTQISFMAQDGNAWDCLMDNIIISNDPDRDLNAIKTITDFS